MPVTIQISPKNVEPVQIREGSVATSSKEFLSQVAPSCAKECVDVIQSSLEKEAGTVLLPSDNGFVYSLIKAYNQHHNLIIRPEDVWFAILTQFTVYVNKHAEELRGKFVAHKGQKELELKYDQASRYDIDMRKFAISMGEKLSENVVDKELRGWLMPAFSTTTLTDSVVASIIMMGSMQKYFKYTMYCMCGVPNVTLLGTREDWETILLRLDKLKDWGDETTQFAQFLKPVLKRFLLSFDEPTSEETIDFWKHIASYMSEGSGATYYSGWITAFCFWGKDGKSIHSPPRWTSGEDENEGHYTLDGVVYPWVDTQEIPPGWISVPVKIVEPDQSYQARMVAGSVGIQCEASSESRNGKELDTVRPKVGWWMFEVGETSKEEEDEEPGSIARMLKYLS